MARRLTGAITEPNARSINAVRIYLQFPVVFVDLNHSFPQQDRSLQAETFDDACEEVLPGLSGRGKELQCGVCVLQGIVRQTKSQL